MPQISWITWKEKVVGRDSPKYQDVDNRPLRQIVELHGWDPDDANFSGLNHFPIGAYVDDLYEQTAAHGITVHNDMLLHDVDLTLDTGDINLTSGVLNGAINTMVVRTSLTIGNDVGDIPTYAALLDVAENATFTCRSIDDAEIRFLNILTEAVNYAPGRVWSEHKVGGHRWMSFDPTAAAETLIWWTDSKKHMWTKGVGLQLEIDGYAAGDGEIRSWVKTIFNDQVWVSFGLSGGRQLVLGAADSAGVGFKTVRVAN